MFLSLLQKLEKFMGHQSSQAHHHYVSVTAHHSNPISAQLSSTWGKQQEVARHYLMKIASSVRGHTDVNGNLHQLLKFRAEEDDPILLKCTQAPNCKMKF
ncbi:hypothetical protein AMECASPLE_030578 [Ameca splendens]|uniref:Uncharacterized protein n=1 Tax=Ameca splendens TaxID=208324 RepID=A0ABV0Y6M4_9TELE